MAEPTAWNPFQAPESCASEAQKPAPTPTQIGRFWGILFGSYFLGQLSVLILQAMMLGRFSKWFPYLASAAVLWFFLMVLFGWLGPRLGLLKNLVEVPCYALVAAIVAVAVMWVATTLGALAVMRVPLSAHLLGSALGSTLPTLLKAFFMAFAYLFLMCLIIWWRLRVRRSKLRMSA